jgi:hypothetical protein
MFKLVTHSIISVLMFRLEAIFEVFRVANKEFGFLAECIRSEFPLDGLPELPKKAWGVSRVSIDTANIWMPKGGGSPGTLLLQVSRVDLGFPIADKIIKAIVNKAASTLVDNLIKSATRAKEPGTIWQERLARDKEGLYAELKAVEEVAAKRREVSSGSPPELDVFARMGDLAPIDALLCGGLDTDATGSS